MVIEYCRPSWPEKHSPTPMDGPKNTKTVPDTFVYTRAEQAVKNCSSVRNDCYRHSIRQTIADVLMVLDEG